MVPATAVFDIQFGLRFENFRVIQCAGHEKVAAMVFTEDEHVGPAGWAKVSIKYIAAITRG